MANSRRNSQDINTSSATTTLTNTSSPQNSAKENGHYPNLHDPSVVNVNEPNNNTISTIPASKQGVLQSFPEMFTDIDLTNHNNKLNDSYINGDLYKSYILGKFLSHNPNTNIPENLILFICSLFELESVL